MHITHATNNHTINAVEDPRQVDNMFKLKSMLQIYTGLHTQTILPDDAFDTDPADADTDADADPDPDDADDGGTTHVRVRAHPLPFYHNQGFNQT